MSKTLLVWVKVHKHLLDPNPEVGCAPDGSERGRVSPPWAELERGLTLGSESEWELSCSCILRGTWNAVY